LELIGIGRVIIFQLRKIKKNVEAVWISSLRQAQGGLFEKLSIEMTSSLLNIHAVTPSSGNDKSYKIEKRWHDFN
jgi:hypothetical protein